MADWKNYVREHLADLALGAEREMEIVDELAQHLEAVYEQALIEGSSERDAYAKAATLIRDWRLLECEVSRVEHSGISPWMNQRQRMAAKIQDEEKRKGGFTMESLIHDLRYGLRTLSKSPGFTLVAILALAMGIGANTAIFTVVNAVLLRPLPYPDSERLVTLFDAEFESGSSQALITPADFVEWRAQQSSLENISVYTGTTFNLTGGSTPAYVSAKTVSAEFFNVLGVQPVIGRRFLPEENQPGKGKVVVLCHTLWQRHFNSDPQVTGKTVKLDGESYVVIGVMPESFRFLGQKQPDLIAPLELDRNYRRNSFLQVIARLKSGVTREQAEKEMQTISARLKQVHPNGGLGARMVPFQELTAFDHRLALWVLFGAIGFVLLIACANLANLFLARSAVRQKEIAIRAAVGASRWRLVRQLLTESMTLSMLGGLFGLLLAIWGVEALVALAPPSLPRINVIGIDLWVLGFTFSVSLLTGTLFGIAPTLRSSNPDLVNTLKDGGRTAQISGFRRFSLRGALVIGEVAIALVLLAGAGLMLNSLMRLMLVERGFSTDNVLVIDAMLPDSYKTNEQVAGFYDRTLSRLRALPGVAAAGAVNQLPLGDMSMQGDFSIEGRPPLPDAIAFKPFVSPDYFRVMGINITRGREFNDRDTTTANKVAVVSERLVRNYFEGENPIGKRISIFNDNQDQPIWLEVVGVVGDIKQRSLSMATKPGIYTPLSQARHLFMARFMSVVIKTDTDPMTLAPAAQREIQQVDPDLPMISIRTMDQVVSSSVSDSRFNTLLFGIFAAMALVLAAAGIYGVLSFSVAQRTHEIGIRMALGAQVRDVLRLIIGQGMIPVLIGVGAGLIGSLALTRLVKTLLFNVSATDPMTLVIVTVALTVIALLACWIPARRAAKVDPTIALRVE